MKNPIYIVRIESIRYFDDCQNSYLPIFHAIFGVYTTETAAKGAVWSTFGDSDKYEPIFENDIRLEEAPCADDIFKYVDKRYGGYAYYAVYYHKSWIRD